MDVACAICKGPVHYAFTIHGFRIYECVECIHRMTAIANLEEHFKRIYSDEYFFGGGSGYCNYLNEKDILIQHGRNYGKIIEKVSKSQGKVLDIGAGAGFILKGLTEHGWEGFGIEPNPNVAAYANEKMGLNVQVSTIEGFQTPQQFDLICFFQVIAHLADPRHAIDLARRILVKNGLILIETWNFKSLFATVFGKYWHEYSPPSVLHWFSKNSLDKMMHLSGFKYTTGGRPKKRILAEHAKSLIRYKLRESALKNYIDRILGIIPDDLTFIYPPEDLFWVIYRKID